MRCWNCGLPDVGERCPRCGAPQERRGPGMPPPAPPAPPGDGRPPSGFIVNGAPVDMRPDGPVSGPLPPRTPSSPSPPRPGNTSDPLPPRPGPTSGPLPPRVPSGPLPPRPASTSGPLSARLAQSGPMPAQPGRLSGALPGGSDQRMRGPSGPMGWDDSGAPPENRRGASPNWAPGRSGAQPLPPGASTRNWPDEAPMEPPGREYSQPMPRGPIGHWEDEVMPGRAMSRPLPGTMQNSAADLRDEKRQARRASEAAARPEPTWDDDYHWGWTDQEVLTLSGAVNALVGAAIGGLLGAAAWVGVVVATGLTLPYLTVLVGILAGIGARLALEQTRPWSLGLFAALGAAVAYVVAQYGLFDVALVRQGTATSWFALSPVHFVTVYVDYIIGVADDVNTALRQSGTHPIEPLFLLICMGVCWLLVLRRKR